MTQHLVVESDTHDDSPVVESSRTDDASDKSQDAPPASTTFTPQGLHTTTRRPSEEEDLVLADVEEEEEEEESARYKQNEGNPEYDDQQSIASDEEEDPNIIWNGASPQAGGRAREAIAEVNSEEEDEAGEGGWAGGGPVATVKLVLETGEGVITRAWPLHQSINSLKIELSTATQVPAHYLQLSIRGRVLGDDWTLRGVGVEANETVQVGVSSKRPHTHPLTLLPPTTPTIPTPDVITVIVVQGGEEREVVVEVEWAPTRKPWLGGYRHKVTGINYHNAATQTIIPTRIRPAQVTRCSQTVKTRACGTQTRREAFTQTSNFHPLLEAYSTSTFITPMTYSPVPRYEVAKIVDVQRAVRGWLARKRIRRLRQNRAQEEAAIRAAKALEIQQLPDTYSEEATITSVSPSSSYSSEHPHKEWSRQQVPMTELYSRLEAWRRKQVSQINGTMTGNPRKRALLALLDKETELLRSLEAHRAVRSAKRRNAAINNFLHEVSRAQVWEVGGDGGGVEVETPDTEPVRTLAALAAAFQHDATLDLRLQQLITLAATVETFRPSRGETGSSERTGRDLLNLARRGHTLLTRGTSDTRLKGLRKRLHTLIINYLHQVQGRDSSTVVVPRSVRAAGAKPVLTRHV